jgi:hypothetical protein
MDTPLTATMCNEWRRDTQRKDTQHNNIQHNDSQYYDTPYNDTHKTRHSAY